jgi:hypothetical protein
MEERHIQGFGGLFEGKRPFGRPRRRWEDNCGSSESGMGHELD